MKYIFTTVLVLAITCVVCWAQPLTDTSRLGALEKTMASNFDKAIDKQSWLYNGTGYILERRVVNTGNPFYLDTLEMNNGNVNYYGFEYNNVPLLYDIARDVVISLFSDHYSRYYFTNQELSSFDIRGHHFIRINADTTGGKQLKTGFYDELFNGRHLQVLARYTKYISGAVVNGKIGEYIKRNSYYVRKDGKYFPIDSQGALLDLFSDRKKELKKLLRDKQVRFGKQPEQALVIVAAYTDSQSN